MAKRSALGRGLGALIEDANKLKEAGSFIDEIAISKIKTNPFQPRSDFDNETLQELASSVREIGIIQPVILRESENGTYQIIAGERRLRAAKMAGLKKIPAYVRSTDDVQMLEWALVENIQREDLNAIEIALSYQRLIDECKLTQENLSERVGKKRSTISNYTRLLKLPAIIQKAIRDKEISMGQAKALVSLDNAENQVIMFEEIMKHDYSVREVEQMVKNFNTEKEKITQRKKASPKYPHEYQALKDHLDKFFRTDVQFNINARGRGKIVIPFKSPGDLEQIAEVLDKLNL